MECEEAAPGKLLPDVNVQCNKDDFSQRAVLRSCRWGGSTLGEGNSSFQESLRSGHLKHYVPCFPDPYALFQCALTKADGPCWSLTQGI